MRGSIEQCAGKMSVKSSLCWSRERFRHKKLQGVDSFNDVSPFVTMFEKKLGDRICFLSTLFASEHLVYGLFLQSTD